MLKKKVFFLNVSHQIWSSLWVMNAGIAVPRFHPIAMENRGLACKKQYIFDENCEFRDFGKKYFSYGKFLIFPRPTYFAFWRT